ncbi:MAG: hypothetical protein ABIQ79_06605 [Nitrospiraceae bacterium]
MVVHTVLDDHPGEILTAGDSLGRYRRWVPDSPAGSPSRIFDKGDVTSEEPSVIGIGRHGDCAPRAVRAPTKKGFRYLQHDMTKPGILLALTILERRNFNGKI